MRLRPWHCSASSADDNRVLFPQLTLGSGGDICLTNTSRSAGVRGGASIAVVHSPRACLSQGAGSERHEPARALTSHVCPLTRADRPSVSSDFQPKEGLSGRGLYLTALKL